MAEKERAKSVTGRATNMSTRKPNTLPTKEWNVAAHRARAASPFRAIG